MIKIIVRVLLTIVIIMALFAAAILYFTWPFKSDKVELKNLEGNRGTAIMIFGDDAVAGSGVMAKERFTYIMAKRLKDKLLIFGETDDTTERARDRLDSIIENLKDQPKIAIVYIGGNDSLNGIPFEKSFSNLKKIIRKIQEVGAVVILVEHSAGAEYHKRFKKLAKEEGVLLVNPLKKIWETPEMTFANRITPNEKGHLFLAEEFIRVVNGLKEKIR